MEGKVSIHRLNANPGVTATIRLMKEFNSCFHVLDDDYVVLDIAEFKSCSGFS